MFLRVMIRLFRILIILLLALNVSAQNTSTFFLSENHFLFDNPQIINSSELIADSILKINLEPRLYFITSTTKEEISSTVMYGIKLNADIERLGKDMFDYNIQGNEGFVHFFAKSNLIAISICPKPLNILNKFTPIVDPMPPPKRRNRPILKSTFFLND